MKRLTLLSSILLFLLVQTGFAEIGGIAQSKYNQQVFTNTDDYQQYINLVHGQQGQVLNDELGIYIFKFYDNDNYLCRAHFRAADTDGVRSLFTTGKGLVQPLYKIDFTGSRAEADWEKSESFIKELVEKGFNVYPTEYSRKYDPIFKNKLSIAYSTDGNLSQLSMYDEKFLNDLIANIGKFDYIVYPSIFVNNMPIYATMIRNSKSDNRMLKKAYENAVLVMKNSYLTMGYMTFINNDLTKNYKGGIAQGGGNDGTLEISCEDVQSRRELISKIDTWGPFNDVDEKTAENAQQKFLEFESVFVWEVKDILKLSGFQISKPLD